MHDITRARKTVGLTVAGLLAGGLLLGPAVMAAEEPAPAEWEAITLAPLHEGDHTTVNDVNDDTTSVGSSDGVPVRWDAEGVATALELPEDCTSGEATTINEQGEAAGWAVCGSSSFHRGIAWTAEGEYTTLDQTLHIEDRADNDVLVGQRNPASLTNDQAFAYYGGSRTDLASALASSSVANGVTEYGFVVGTLSGVPTLPSSVAVGWWKGVPFPLVLKNLVTEGVDVTESAHSLVQVREDGNDRGVIVEPSKGASIALSAEGVNDEVVDLNEAGVTVGSRELADDEGTIGGFYLATGEFIGLDGLVDDETAAAYGDFDAPAALNDLAEVVGNHGDGSWLLRPAAEETTTTTAAPTSTTAAPEVTTTTVAPEVTTTTVAPEVTTTTVAPEVTTTTVAPEPTTTTTEPELPPVTVPTIPEIEIP